MGLAEMRAQMRLMKLPTLEPTIGRGDRKSEIALVPHAVKWHALSDLADQLKKLACSHAGPGNEVAPENGESPATTRSVVAIGAKKTKPPDLALMAVGFVACGVTMTNQGLRALTVGAGSLPEFGDQAEELVMAERKEVGKLESHSGIIPEVANQTPR